VEEVEFNGVWDLQTFEYLTI